MASDSNCLGVQSGTSQDSLVQIQDRKTFLLCGKMWMQREKRKRGGGKKKDEQNQKFNFIIYSLNSFKLLPRCSSLALEKSAFLTVTKKSSIPLLNSSSLNCFIWAADFMSDNPCSYIMQVWILNAASDSQSWIPTASVSLTLLKLYPKTSILYNTATSIS